MKLLSEITFWVEFLLLLNGTILIFAGAVRNPADYVIILLGVAFIGGVILLENRWSSTSSRS